MEPIFKIDNEKTDVRRAEQPSTHQLSCDSTEYCSNNIFRVGDDFQE